MSKEFLSMFGVFCLNCRSLLAGNWLLVLCWSWCDAVPVRKGRRHLHWEGSCCFIFFSFHVNVLPSQPLLLFSWALPGSFLFQWGQQCIIFSSVCGSLIEKCPFHLYLSSNVYLFSCITAFFSMMRTFFLESTGKKKGWISFFFSSQKTQLLITACCV